MIKHPKLERGYVIEIHWRDIYEESAWQPIDIEHKSAPCVTVGYYWDSSEHDLVIVGTMDPALLSEPSGRTLSPEKKKEGISTVAAIPWGCVSKKIKVLRK